jgi:hypothetical protein
MATQYTAGLSAGQILTAATMNQIGAEWETWTPALTAATTNPTLGTGGTTNGRYGRIQKVVIGLGFIQFGTAGTAAGSGLYYVSLPVTAQAAGRVIGDFQVYDGTSLWRVGTLVTDTTSRAYMMYEGSFVNNTQPWAWGTNDFIRYSFTYEAA